ncbi:hypothetical protein QF000_007114 [Paraburkholderia atlantica]
MTPSFCIYRSYPILHFGKGSQNAGRALAQRSIDAKKRGTSPRFLLFHDPQRAGAAAVPRLGEASARKVSLTVATRTARSGLRVSMRSLS